MSVNLCYGGSKRGMPVGCVRAGSGPDGLGHTDLSRNPPGPVSGGVREGLACFPNPDFQRDGVKCLRLTMNLPQLLKKTRSGTVQGGAVPLEPFGGSSAPRRRSARRQGLLHGSLHASSPTLCPQGGEQQQLGVRQHRTGQHRVTPGWVCPLTPGLSEGLGPLGAGPASCRCRCAPSRSAWEKPCRASTDSNTRSVPVLCLPRDPQSAGSVHYTN